jgi:predicted acyltransferase
MAGHGKRSLEPRPRRINCSVGFLRFGLRSSLLVLIASAMKMATSEATQQSPPPAASAGSPTRLVSLDAYRGFVMFLMMAEVLNLRHVARARPESGFWQFLAHHQSHVEWIGCSLHDLIQPSFSFLVGVALPYSLASRAARGQSRGQMALHAAWRSLLLVLLGVFLRSIGQPQTYWTFEDTLTQIGLGYFFLFLLGLRPVRDQWIAFVVILLGYWGAFAFYPLPGTDFDYSKVGVSKDWPHLLSGFAAHWNKNSSLAWAFDTWFLNLFPRQRPFSFNGGGYATLSFIPTLATMLLGLIAGGILRSPRGLWKKARWLSVAGVLGLAAGAAFGASGVCPVVKRIWTPSWTLYSGGWCFLLLAGFYVVIELWGRRRWAFPLVVIGMNSIAAYCIAHLFDGFVTSSLATHFSADTFRLFGNAYESLFNGAAVLLVFWLILLWMYRRKIFLRI